MKNRRKPRELAQVAPRRHKLWQPKIRTKNMYEVRVSEALKREGYIVARRGWPDFLAYRPSDGDIRFVEVKPPGKRLSPNQALVAEILRSLGARVEVTS